MYLVPIHFIVSCVFCLFVFLTHCLKLWYGQLDAVVMSQIAYILIFKEYGGRQMHAQNLSETGLPTYMQLSTQGITVLVLVVSTCSGLGKEVLSCLQGVVPLFKKQTKIPTICRGQQMPSLPLFLCCSALQETLAKNAGTLPANIFPCRSIYVIYVNHWLVLTEQDGIQCCLISSIFYLSKRIWINLVGSDYNTKHQQCSLNHLYTPQTIFPLCSCTYCKGIRLNLQQRVYTTLHLQVSQPWAQENWN